MIESVSFCLSRESCGFRAFPGSACHGSTGEGREQYEKELEANGEEIGRGYAVDISGCRGGTGVNFVGGFLFWILFSLPAGRGLSVRI